MQGTTLEEQVLNVPIATMRSHTKATMSRIPYGNKVYKMNTGMLRMR
jgi:hypothetical protein